MKEVLSASFLCFLYVIFQKQIFSHIYIKENKVQKETPIMKIEKEELGEKMYDAFMFLAIIALIVCLCFADKLIQIQLLRKE